jgi:hypothetical protein
VRIFVIDKKVSDTEARTNDFAKIAFHNDRKKQDGITLWDVKDTQMGVSNAMKVYSMLQDEVMDIINKRLENGPTNKEQAQNRGVRD